MKLIKQTKISSQDGTVNGNCFSTCLSILTNVDIELIPMFEEMGQSWHQPFFEFLKEHNFEFEGTGHKLEKLKKYEGIDGYVIVFGKSPREYVKRGHSVIYKHGDFYFDPHPSNDGLTSVDGYYMIKKN